MCCIFLGNSIHYAGGNSTFFEVPFFSHGPFFLEIPVLEPQTGRISWWCYELPWRQLRKKNFLDPMCKCRAHRSGHSLDSHQGGVRGFVCYRAKVTRSWAGSGFRCAVSARPCSEYLLHKHEQEPFIISPELFINFSKMSPELFINFSKMSPELFINFSKMSPELFINFSKMSPELFINFS